MRSPGRSAAGGSNSCMPTTPRRSSAHNVTRTNASAGAGSGSSRFENSFGTPPPAASRSSWKRREKSRRTAKTSRFSRSFARVSGFVRPTADVLQHGCGKKRKLQGLSGVQPRVTGRFIAVREVGVSDVVSAAETFGDVLAGEFDMQSARNRAERLMDLEKSHDFFDDVIEMPRLQPAGGFDRVAVHGVATPDHLSARRGHLLHDRGQHVADPPGAHPRN